MDNADLIEDTEVRLHQLLTEANRKGLSYWRLLWVLLNIVQGLYLKAEAEKVSR